MKKQTKSRSLFVLNQQSSRERHNIQFLATRISTASNINTGTAYEPQDAVDDIAHSLITFA